MCYHVYTVDRKPDTQELKMNSNDYRDGMYVCLRKGKDATIYVARSLSGLTVAIQEADIEKAVTQYVDVSLLIPATEEQLAK